MKELYILASVVLGIAAVSGTMSTTKYQYETKVLPSDDYTPPQPEAEEELKDAPQLPVVTISEKNLFDVKRGEVDETKPIIGEVVTPIAQSNFTFVLRGVAILGEKKVASISVSAARRPTSSSSRRPSSRSSSSRSTSRTIRTPVSSVKIKEYKVGDSVKDNNDTETGFTIKEIHSLKVIIENQAKEVQTLSFDFASEESLARRETAYKTALLQQKAAERAASLAAAKERAIAARAKATAARNTIKPVPTKRPPVPAVPSKTVRQPSQPVRKSQDKNSKSSKSTHKKTYKR